MAQKVTMDEKNAQNDADSLDSVLSYIGEMGLYQKLLFLVMAPMGFSFAFVYSVQNFVIATPQKHWCRVPELGHLDLELRRNLSIPGALTGDFNRCSMFDANWTQVLQTMSPPGPETPTMYCIHGWEFEYEDIPYSTIVSEREWVCDNSRRVPFTISIFYVGCIVGTLLFGSMADRYGRLPALIGANLVGCMGGVASIFTNNFWDYSICRFLVGLSYDNCFMMIYILVLEYVGPRHRTWVANVSIAIYFGGASTILPWLALWISDWRSLVLATSIPMLIVVFAPLVVPESARWLVSKGKTDRAIKLLKRFERVNGTKIPQGVLDEFIISSEASKKLEGRASLSTLFKSQQLRIMMLLMIISYISVAMVFDGLIRMSENMGLDFFVTFTISSSTEIPALALLTLVLDRWGRRNLMCGSVALSGVLSIVGAFVPKGIPQTSVAVCARFFVNMTYNVIYQWATELLPTPLRATGTAIMHVSGFVGGIVSPYVVYSDQVWDPLPLLVFGIASLISCGAGILLPETMGRPLPQTIADGETLMNTSFFMRRKTDTEEHDDAVSEKTR